MRIAKWNYDRGNTNFDIELEERMLDEEAQEFKDGMIMYFDSVTAIESRADALVELVDAWCDYHFVFQGTVFKALGTSYSLDRFKLYERFMWETLTRQLGITKDTLEDCLNIVIDANELKGKAKVNGKTVKGDAWVDPKELILEVLKGAGYV